MRSWARPVGEGSAAQVTLEAADAAAGHTYRIEFPFLVGDQSANDIQVTGAGTIEAHHVRSHGGLPVSDLVVSLPADCTVERVIVRSRPERLVVHLPSVDLIDRCDRVLDGDGAAADELIEGFPSPVQIPLICGSFLGTDETVRLLGELVRRDRYVQSMVHSYRYAIVRSAVVSRTGLHVGTLRALQALINGLDAIPEIGAVSLVDAVADIVATVHDTPEETEQLLESLDVDVEALLERDEGLFTACFLAHIASTAGVEAALAYELPQKLPPRGHYERRKRAVFRAAYGERGTAWRRLLNAARRQSADEVGYVLAYTLYWTGEESRSDSRMAELLFRGAERVAAHTGLRRIEHRARFKRLLAAGHRLRGTHCWAPSIANFEAAREVAAEQSFLDEWAAILPRGLVLSRKRSQDGDHAGAIEALDHTLEALLAADPPNAAANRSVRHIRAQKCEIESLRYRSDDPDRARGLLEEARAHYAAIGLDRSSDKIERMLAALPETPAPEGPVTSQLDGPARQPPAGAERSASPSSDAAVDSVGPAAETVETDGDWLQNMEYPDEDEMDEAYHARFDDPYPS